MNWADLQDRNTKVGRLSLKAELSGSNNGLRVAFCEAHLPTDTDLGSYAGQSVIHQNAGGDCWKLGSSHP